MKTVFEIAKKYNFEARIVGGCPRDFLIYDNNRCHDNISLEEIQEFVLKNNTDVDFAINAPVGDVAEIFRNSNSVSKVVTKYATNIVVIGNKAFEITSTRKDINCDGRYAEMVFTPSFEEDATRRDFTINAIYIDETGKIYDYYNGLNDLNGRIVKFIGDPSCRIVEDYLRIWRFFRFSGIYAKEVDQNGLDACTKHENDSGFLKISAERRTLEILKLLKSKNAFYILEIMQKNKIISDLNIDQMFNQIADIDEKFVLLTKNISDQFRYTRKQRRILKELQ